MIDLMIVIDIFGKLRLIIKISFLVYYLISMLDQNKLNNKGDFFMFYFEFGLISNISGNGILIEIQFKLKEMILQGKGGFIMMFDSIEYYVLYIYLDSLGWYYVDYVFMQ